MLTAEIVQQTTAENASKACTRAAEASMSTSPMRRNCFSSQSRSLPLHHHAPPRAVVVCSRTLHAGSRACILLIQQIGRCALHAATGGSTQGRQCLRHALVWLSLATQESFVQVVQVTAGQHSSTSAFCQHDMRKAAEVNVSTQLARHCAATLAMIWH